MAQKPTLVPASGSTCVRFGWDPILRRATLRHQLLVVVKVDPHVVNCLTMLMQDGGLRDKFNPEIEGGGGGGIIGEARTSIWESASCLDSRLQS